MRRARLALGGWCLLTGACRPADANLGGTWSCPEADAKACFFFDSALGALAQTDNVKALFNAPVDPDPAKSPAVAYPLDETTEPSNIYDLDIQWRRPRSEQKLFRIRIESQALPFGRYELRKCLGRRAGLLSGGEQQMLAVGRALVTRPRLLLVDEMSLGLAPVIVDRLIPVLRRAADELGSSVLFVEQHVALALEVADRAYVLTHGRIGLEGPAAELRERRELLAASYLGETAA